MRARTAILSVLVACAVGAIAPADMAQGAAASPAKPIRLIIPFAPGGASDFVGRIIQPRLGKLTGQNIVIENRAGRQATSAWRRRPRPRPTATRLPRQRRHDRDQPEPLQDARRGAHARFHPDHAGGGRAERAGREPVVPAEQREGADRVREAGAGKYFFASPGPGSANRLEMERFMKSSGIQMTHVPYKGGAGPAITGLLGGETSVMFVTLSSAAAQVRGGN